MPNVLIVFSGKAQSGKSTSASLLKQIIDTKRANENPDINSNRLGDSQAQIFSFAAALKHIAKEYFGWDGNKDFHTQPEIITDTFYQPAIIQDKGRQLLINIGKKFREIRPTIWVDYVINKIKEADKSANDTFFIIDDLRFQNELALAKTFHTCISIRLQRPEQLNLNDISEIDLDGTEFDYHIVNDGDMDKLKINLTELLHTITEKYT
jgi:hypothetical protein